MTAPKYVKTVKNLADALDMHERGLYSWFKREGCPKKTQSGHNVAAWCKFMDDEKMKQAEKVRATGGGNPEERALKIRKLELECEQLQAKIDAINRDTIPMTEHLREIAELAGMVKAVFLQHQNHVSVLLPDAKLNKELKRLCNAALERLQEAAVAAGGGE